VLIALCGCTATYVVTFCKKKAKSFTASIRAKRSGPRTTPKKLYPHRLIYMVRGTVQDGDGRAMRLSKEKYCSVSAMLEKTATITFKLEHE